MDAFYTETNEDVLGTQRDKELIEYNYLLTQIHKNSNELHCLVPMDVTKASKIKAYFRNISYDVSLSAPPELIKNFAKQFVVRYKTFLEKYTEQSVFEFLVSPNRLSISIIFAEVLLENIKFPKKVMNLELMHGKPLLHELQHVFQRLRNNNHQRRRKSKLWLWIKLMYLLQFREFDFANALKSDQRFTPLYMDSLPWLKRIYDDTRRQEEN